MIGYCKLEIDDKVLDEEINCPDCLYCEDCKSFLEALKELHGE